MKLNVNDYLDIAPQVEEALKNGEPVVALESTILSHGMPYPQNSGFAAEVEKIIRAEGAVPATMAMINGRMKAGLTPEELEVMCKADGVAKVSRRDMPIIMATGRTGATTVTTTMMMTGAKKMSGIRPRAAPLSATISATSPRQTMPMPTC